MRQYQAAAEAATTSLGLIFHNPTGHYLLGQALYRMGRFDDAEQAWLRAVNQAPGLKKAHERLVSLYRRQLHQPIKAFEHQNILERITDRQAEQPTPSHVAEVSTVSATPQSGDPRDAHAVHGSEDAPTASGSPTPSNHEDLITIVSGLPRSGTSMMMQMLQAGGLDILSDGQRQADASNPQGYWEYEKVKRLAQDNSWLGEARGKVVKVIAHLLPYLPEDYHYRIIFMQRDLDEVLDSQQTMLQRQDKHKQNPASLRQTYTEQLQRIQDWLARQPHCQVLYVAHRQAITAPHQVTEELAQFIEHPFAAAQAAQVIQPQLYRARHSS
jgi:tetratricopeptide (TPR) repeat protein